MSEASGTHGVRFSPDARFYVDKLSNTRTLPALYLVGRQAIQAEEMREARAASTGLWSEVLSTVDEGLSDRPQLVLNLRSPVVRRTPPSGSRDGCRRPTVPTSRSLRGRGE